jgi:hypothetical protein
MRRRIGAGQSTFIPSRSLSPWWPVLKCLVSRTRSSGARCCIRDEGRCFGAGFQERASNNRQLLLFNGSGGGGERYGEGATGLRHVGSRGTIAIEPPARPRKKNKDDIKPESDTISGKSMEETWLPSMRCPGYRGRDSGLGSGAKLENLFGGAKGKGASGGPARPKVPKHRAGAACSVVAMKRVTTAERRGRAIRGVIDLVNR